MEYHELANVFPMLPDAELEALAADIQANGLWHDITTYQGKILDGRNRYAACVLADVEPRFTEYTGDNPVAFVVSENIARRHLDESQRAMCAARLATMGEGRPNKTASIDAVSQPRAAEMLNVSRPSVQRAAQVIEHGIPELIQAVDRGDMAVSRAAQIAREPEEAQREAVKTPHVSHNSGNNEWYTPEVYIECARRVLEVIDLDPASSKEANAIVKAKRYYTAEDDGLSKKWKGRVWMNPPYSSELIGQFSKKLCKHVVDGDVTEAIVLVNNATEAAWFEEMAELAATVMFTYSRVKFLNRELNPRGAPLQGQALLYFGQNYKKFIKEFSELAWAVNHGKH